MIKVTVAFRRLLESNTFSKDDGNNVNVNTESNFDHIYSGIVSILHFHDNHTPLLNTVPVRSATSSGQTKMMHGQVQCLQIKLLWFKYFLPHQILAKALWENDLNYCFNF